MRRTSTHWKYLERDPKSSYRQLSIKGRRIKARTLYGQCVNAEEPRSIEQLAEDFRVPVEAVREAIEYCQSNPPEIEVDFQEEQALMSAAGMLAPEYKYNPKPKPLTPQQRNEIRRMFPQ